MKSNKHSMFVFPLDLHNIKNIGVVVPDIFTMNIKNNTLMVEIINQYIIRNYFYVEKCEIKLKHRQKINLQQLGDCCRIVNPFAHDYAYLTFTYK